MKKMKGDGNSSRVTHMFPLPKKIMKVSKKLLAAIMAAAMVIPMGTASAFAAETTQTSTTSGPLSTDVKYEVTQGYEWTIHSEINFGKDAGVNQTVTKEENTVSVNKNVIPDGTKLNITVAGSGDDGAFTIANGATKLNYTIKNGTTNIATGETVMDVAAGTNAASKDLTFTLTTGTGSAEVAGNYIGTVSYTATIQ